MASIHSLTEVSLSRRCARTALLFVVGLQLIAVSAAHGAQGYALEFARGDYVDLSDTPIKGLGQCSFSAWVYPTGTASYEGVYMETMYGTGPQGFGVIIRNGSQLGVYIATDGSPTSFLIDDAITQSTWQHVAVSYDGSVAHVYVNGELLESGAASGVFVADGTEGRIGLYANSTSGTFQGRIDEVRLWNVPRTQAEIQASMRQELWGDEPGLIGYWKFNEGEGTTAYDSSPSGHQGTISGATWTADAAPVEAMHFIAHSPALTDGATDVPADIVLSWMPGRLADTHDIYFGTVFEDINDASRAAPLGVLVIQDQTGTSYSPAEALQWNQTYYWRVDEVSAPPDNTIYKGRVWSFTVEPFAYPVDGASITATASSQYNADTRPENTINGSGLDENDLHSTGEADAWVSSAGGAQPTSIQYEFDQVYKLHEMWVWNYNQMMEPLFGFGFKDVTIEYSSDGVVWTTLGTTHEFARAPGEAGHAYDTKIDFAGVLAKYVKLTPNSNWGDLMPQYGLSEIRFFHIPVTARESNPASGATDIAVDDVTLGWRAGREAASHYLYFGEDQQAVTDSVVNPISIPADNSYVDYYAGVLQLDTTYYWKVDEVDGAEPPTAAPGEVWDFHTQAYVVVDDFEDYNDWEPDRIFDTWVDGWDLDTNGSQVGYDYSPFAEQTIVHNGRQSIPFSYNNTAGVTYSEAERTFETPQNWAEHGERTLSLWFFGDVNNVEGQMYVKVNDSKVMYDGDAGDTAHARWQEWNIDLSSFGVNLEDVTRLSVGIDGANATGTLYFDDIRLYPSKSGPAATGYALQFAAGNHVDLPDTPIKGLGQCSFSAWVYPTGTGNYEGIYTEDLYGGGPHGFGMISNSGSRLSVYIFTDGTAVTFTIQGAISPNTWQHLAVSYDGTTAHVYRNGELMESQPASGVFLSDATRGRIGTYAESTSGHFVGRIDEVRIWNVPRAESEIRDQMSRELSGAEAGLIGYWKFNEGEGPTAYDSSPSGRHGTISGATWTTDAAPVAP